MGAGGTNRHAVVKVGRLADVVANLAQRPVGLRHRRCGDLEHVHLAGPHPQLDRDTGRGEPPRGQPSVVQQDLGTGYMDQCAWQTGLDVVKRLVDLVGASVPDVTLARLGDQVANASNASAENIASLRMLGCTCSWRLAICISGDMQTIAASSSPSLSSRSASVSDR